MRAIALTEFDKDIGLVDLPVPEPEPDEVLVRVHASSINPFDVAVAAGVLRGMMEYRFPTVVGRDFAGVVEKAGSAVSRFRAGDEVFGFVAKPVLRDGGWADYVTVEEGMIASKPRELDFLQAAALALAGSAALASVDAVRPSEGDVVLVAGATGGVGSFAVQIAARRGATVVATGHPEDKARLRELGASDVVEYAEGDLADRVRARHPQGVNALIDVVNHGDGFAPLADLIVSGGRAATTLGVSAPEGLAGRNVALTTVMADASPRAFSALAALAASGQLQVPVQRVYRLEEAPEGLAAMRQGGVRGKLGVSVV